MSAPPQVRKNSLPLLTGKPLIVRTKSDPKIQIPRLKAYSSAPTLPFSQALEKLSTESKTSPQISKEELELDQKVRAECDAAAKFAHEVLASVYNSKKT